MFCCIEYTAFLWKAKGRHGTHSPFAYWLVDVVARQKKAQTIDQSISFQTQKEKLFFAKLSSCLPTYPIKDLDDPGLKSDQQYIIRTDCTSFLHHINTHGLRSWHPETIFFISNFNTKLQQRTWLSIIQFSELHFSADCFYFGLLSPRPGQAKEHFYLKLS